MSKDKRSVFYALGFSTASGGPPLVILSLLLIDIAELLDTPLGVLGQMSSVSSFVSARMGVIATLVYVLWVRE